MYDVQNWTRRTSTITTRKHLTLLSQQNTLFKDFDLWFSFDWQIVQLHLVRSLAGEGAGFISHLHNHVGLQMQGSGQGWGNASVLNFCDGKPRTVLLKSI